MAPSAHGLTVTQAIDLNCSTGAAPTGFRWIASSHTFVVSGGLIVRRPGGIRLRSNVANPPYCIVQVERGPIVIENGATVDYDQRTTPQNPVRMNNAGSFTLIVLDNPLTLDGRISADAIAGRNASFLAPGDGEAGGSGGLIDARAQGAAVGGTGILRANGAVGGNASGGLVSLGGNGGAGGNGGIIGLTSDGGPISFGGTATANPGAGGAAFGPGVAGARGGPGVIRRNGRSLSGAGGTFNAAVTLTNIAPTGLRFSGTPAAGGPVTLQWDDRSDEETQFAILRQVDGGATETAGVVGPNVRTFTDPRPLESGRRYTYAVRADFVAPVWLNGSALSEPLTISLATPTPTISTGSGFRINRYSFSGTFRQYRNRRRIAFSLRSNGNGRLNISVPIGLRGGGSQQVSVSTTVTRGTNNIAFNLPSGWAEGTYTMTFQTTGGNGEVRTQTKRQRFRYRH